MKKLSSKMQEALELLKLAPLIVKLEGSKPVSVYPDNVSMRTLKALEKRELVERKFKSLSYDHYILRVE